MKFSIEQKFSEELINEVAKSTEFVKRDRKISAFNFVNTLMFSVCNQRNTSLPDITTDLKLQFDTDISKEALHKKFTPECVAFFEELLKIQLAEQFRSPLDDSVKSHFPAIKIKDSSKFSLPDTYGGDYPGYGNFSKKNGLMNFQYEYDLVSGKWNYIKLTNHIRNDQQDSKETIHLINKGDLHIRDLGYVSPTYLEAVLQNKAYFLNRLPAQASVYNLEKEPIEWKKLHRKFIKTNLTFLEIDILLYEKHLLPCRMLIERVSDQEYQKRLKRAENSAKSKGVGISDIHKIKCRYNIFITNVSKKILPAKRIRKIYYLRWQIELVFKTWKSFFEINKVKKVKKERLECQLMAKLLWILLNWKLFCSVNRYVQKINPERGVSLLIFFKRSILYAPTLRMVLLKRLNICKWLTETFLVVIDSTECQAPKNKNTHYQELNSFIIALS